MPAPLGKVEAAPSETLFSTFLRPESSLLSLDYSSGHFFFFFF